MRERERERERWGEQLGEPDELKRVGGGSVLRERESERERERETHREIRRRTLTSVRHPSILCEGHR